MDPNAAALERRTKDQMDSGSLTPFDYLDLPKQLQTGIRLEQIFMPEACRRRMAFFSKHPQPADKAQPIYRVAHYTSADAALKIINSKRMWMRNTTCMTDYSEVRHGYALLNKFVSDEARWGAFAEALDACAQGAAKKALDAFVPWTASASPSAIHLNTYIASVSEHDDNENFHGRLSMWRGFGHDDTRVAIVLRLPFFSGAADALSLLFSPVAYLTQEKVFNVVDEIIANIRANRDYLTSLGEEMVMATVFRMLQAGVTCLKHEGFGEELEWRAMFTRQTFGTRN
jgi:hypothetical protein